MKRRWMSMLLTAALTLSLIPPVTVSAAGSAGVPNGFQGAVVQPLMPVPDGGLYDEPALPLPDPSDSGFVGAVEAGAPAMPASGLMAEVGEAPMGATEISTAEQLQAMTKGTYVLTADIDLSAVEWTPIDLSAKGSSIVLDGQGHTVKGLSLKAVTEGNCGLFSYVYGDFTVKNLRMDAVQLALAVTEDTVTSEYGAGALAGRVRGNVTLENVAADVTIERTGAYVSKVGGLIGWCTNGTVKAADVAAEVSMPATDDTLVGIGHYPAIGGVVGSLAGGSIFEHCYVEANLNIPNLTFNTDHGVGGIAGSIESGQKVTAFTDCLVEGTLYADWLQAGGLAGKVIGGLNLNNCVVEADITGAVVGGYCAYLQNYSTKSTCVDCRYSGKLTLETIRDSYAGGFFGYGSADFTTCAADVTIDAVGATSKNCYLGGFMGDGGGTVKGCALDVTVSDFSGTQLFLGGMAGDGSCSVTDTAVELDAVEIKGVAGTANIGGLVGGANSTVLKAENCGAQVFVNVASPGRDVGLYMGGLLGRGSGSMVKCWADGKIYLTNPGNKGKAYYLGGLAGSGGSMSQCYGGVDIHCACYPDSTTAYGVVGGLAGSGSSMLSCWSDAEITADGKTYFEQVGGLCGTSNGSTYRDCTFTGAIEAVKVKELGGILGSCQKGYFYNCYVEGDLSGGLRTGGLLGQASHNTVFADCRFEGSVTALEDGGAGGIISAESGVLNGTATLGRCEVSADITAPGGNAYGLAGPAKAYDCSFRGELTGANMGGIGESGDFYDCTATVRFNADQRDAQLMDVGGIAAKKVSVASNCSVTNNLRLSVDMDENRNSLQIRFGGIGGVVHKAEDCETKGMALSCYGDDSSVDEEKEDDRFVVYMGGIAGEMYKGMDNCRVSGSVSASLTLGTIYVGGLAGKDTSSVNGSSITGCVAVGSSGSLKKGVVYAGGLAGYGTDKTLISGSATGSGLAICRDREEAAHSGKWTGNDKYDTGSKVLNIPERPSEICTIMTFAYPDATETTNSTVTPLAGVTVTAGDTVLGKTDSAGILNVELDKVGGSDQLITGSKDGYFSDDSGVTLAGGGSTSLYLMKRTQGKIYLTSALYTRDNARTNSRKTMDLLSDPNSVVIMRMDTKPQEVSFGVDWNGADEDGRVLQLNNAAGNNPLAVKANEEDELYIQQHFEPEEDIYLEAKARFGGVEVTEKAKLKLKVKDEVPDVTVPETNADFGGDQGLYFLDGLGVGLNFGNLAKVCDEWSFENGILKLRMNWEKGTNKTTELFTNRKVGWFIGGEIQVPYSEEGQGEWSGAVQGGINTSAEKVEDWKENNKKQETGKAATAAAAGSKSKEDEGEIIEWEHTVLVGPGIPINITSKFGVGVMFDIGVTGKYDAAEFYGKVQGNGKVAIAVGTGISLTEDWEASAEGEGRAEIKLPIVYKLYHDAPEFDPELEGKLLVAVVLKGGELLDFSLEYDVGGFVWNKNGVTWRLFGEDIGTTPSTRAYLASGGGFVDGEMERLISTLAIGDGWSDIAEDAAGEKRLVYENIQRASSAVLSVENETPVLYFTADDGAVGTQGRMADHTVLWRSEQQSDGSWGDPVAITDGGYPDEVRADGAYAVWVESEKTASFDELLTTTDIRIARDGAVIKTVDGGGYVYAPEIAADEQGNILAVWLSDAGVNGENFVPSEQKLQYARYNASSDKWSTGTAATQETAVSTTLVPGNTTAIWFSDKEGTLYKVTGSSFGTCTQQLTGLSHFATDGNITVSIAEGGLLTVWEEAEQTAELELGTGIVGQPVLCREGENLYAVWAQGDGVYYADSTDGWTSIKTVCGEEGLASRLSAVIVDGRPLVSYYRSESSESSVTSYLISAYAPDISGTDLELSDLELDSRYLGEMGVVRLTGKVTNRMKTAQSGYAYRVSDETGAAVASGEVTLEEALALGNSDEFGILIGHDVMAAHSYTVEITPLTGTDAVPGNNTATVHAEAESALSETSFRKTHEGVALEAIVRNIGAAPEDNLTVAVYRADLSGAAVGEALLTQEVEGLLPGSCRQILLNNTQSDVYYKVVLMRGEEELDSEMLMWSDPEISGIWVQNVDVEENGKSCVTVLARDVEEDVQLHLALYQGGKMVANAMKHVSAWDGSKDIELDVGELPAGEYICAVYLLRQDDMSPMSTKYSCRVDIE